MFYVSAIFIVSLVLFATISKAENSEHSEANENVAKITGHEPSSTIADIRTSRIKHDDNLLDRSSIPSFHPPSPTNNKSRVINQMRQFSNPLFDNIDWTDMAFKLLGLNSDECRQRFTCELDFRVKQIPFSSYMVNSNSPAFLNKYREQSNDVNQATTFSDCALFYGECKYSLLG